MKKLLLFLIIGLFLISFASSTDLGTSKQGDCISLYQYCDDCTYVNLTAIQYPNGTTTTMNLGMTKDDVNYNYTFCNTTYLGTYFYTVKGDKAGAVSVERLSFEVTGGGATPTTAQALMYGIVLFILLILFIGSLLWFNSIQWGHYTAEEGVIVQVNEDRTKKLLLFFSSYLLFLLFSFVGKSMAENFMFLDDTPVFFDVVFNILLVSIAPVLICVIVLAIITTIADTKLHEALLRGLEVR